MIAFLGSVGLNFHYGFHILFFFLSLIGALFTGHYDSDDLDNGDIEHYRD